MCMSVTRANTPSKHARERTRQSAQSATESCRASTRPRRADHVVIVDHEHDLDLFIVGPDTAPVSAALGPFDRARC